MEPNNIPKTLQVIILLFFVDTMETHQQYSRYPHHHQPYHILHQHDYQPHEHLPHYQQLQPMREVDSEYRYINTHQAVNPTINLENIPRDFDIFNYENITFPGTKWCGPGHVANNYDDLGFFRDADKCCRDHDHCEHIAPGNTSHNIYNGDQFTLMKCTCDIDFLYCLKGASLPGYIIGKCYFHNEKRKPVCYGLTPPLGRCKFEHELTDIFGKHKRCEHYFYKRGPVQYRLLDLPLYTDEEDERSAIDEEEIVEKNYL